MKTKILIFTFASLLLVGATVSCGDANTHRNTNFTLSQISKPTDADSLMYYFGQLLALKYWDDAETDSVLRTDEGRKEYLAGVQDALKALNRSEAYLQGLMDGADHAENIIAYSRNYGRDFNADIMMKSMRSTIYNENAPDLTEVRGEFYTIRNRMETMRDAREESQATAALEAAAEKMGMTKVSNDLWKKVMVEGAGAAVVRGSHVQVAIQLTTLSGHQIPITLPNEVRVGARLVSTVFTDAFLSMKYGERCEFLTTALALFGSHSRQMGLKPNEVIVITMSIIGEAAGVNEDTEQAAGALISNREHE